MHKPDVDAMTRAYGDYVFCPLMPEVNTMIPPQLKVKRHLPQGCSIWCGKYEMIQLVPSSGDDVRSPVTNYEVSSDRTFKLLRLATFFLELLVNN